MKIKDIALSAAYVGQRVVKAIAVGAQEVWSAVKYIVFKDPVVAQICATKWGDGVGITEEQASAVTDIGNVFGNSEITSFDEFEKFINVTLIPAWAFSQCYSLTDIVLPPNVTILDDGAFWQCGFKTFRLTQKVTKLVGRVFYGCASLEEIYIPRSLSSVTGSAFSGCSSMKRVIIDDLESWCNITFAGGDDYPMRQACDIYIGDYLLDDVVIPYGIAELKNHTFWRSTIKSVSMPNTTVVIGSTFAYCKKLEYADLPESVESIGGWCFYDCSNLQRIMCRAITPPALGQLALSGTSAALYIYVPDQSVTAYREASGWIDYADKIKPLSEYVEQ